MTSTHRSFKLLCVVALVAIVALLCTIVQSTEARRGNRRDGEHHGKRHHHRRHAHHHHHRRQPAEWKQFIQKKQQKLQQKWKRHSKIAKEAVIATNAATTTLDKKKNTNNNNNQTASAVVMADGKHSVDFSFLLLSLNWPGSACMSLKPCNGLSPKYTNFTIHGLWPNYESGKGGPESCGEAFNYNVVKSILPSLRQYWPDFKPDEPNFWKHEYEKHGNCAVAGGVVKDQLDYFVKTINLVKQMPIMSVLSRAGIVASNSVKYKKNAILDTITRSGISGRPFMTCQNNIYVRELRFCFNKQLKPIDCNNASGGCADEVFLKPVEV